MDDDSSPLTPPGFRDLGLRTGPDPSAHPVEQLQLARAIQAERDYMNARLEQVKQMFADRDLATVVLNDVVNRVPTDVQQAVGSLQAVMDERFRSIENQFKERDTRQEREARDNKVAVDAAFAAQKEAALAQDTSNAKAIAKSEAATNESISKLGELQGTNTNALSDKIDDVKMRLTAVESARMGGMEVRGDHRMASNLTAIWIGVAASFIIGITAIISLFIHFH